MRQGFLLFICLGFCLIGKAQSKEFDFVLNKEGKIIALPKKKDYTLNIPKISYETYQPANTQELDKKLREFTPNYQSLTLDERPMNMQVQSEAYRPFYNVYAPMLRRITPMAFDFNETSTSHLHENWALVLNGRQHSWPGAGGLTTIHSALVWHKDKLSIAGSGYAGHYYTPFNLSPEHMVGVNLHLRYEATDRLALQAWGQYSHYIDKKEKYNPHLLMNPFYNHTSVGGSMEFKINENVGIGVGVNYEYNPWNRKMERQFLLYPVFQSKGFRIGVQ
ncbi:hypothetical protein D0T51_03720 [Parabacteroides sp. 52]|uniref:hypothetical protein n=1 Tax=unclassified Parabacteroides TaxID=2649774 RepID=UPI0013D70657|nr:MULTISPECIES: hypothetical protein [unclassified Parabacteroides]MDH6534345.1 hypothetical protein [Parabacteroides sp. PM5-20]NDV54843.1 hypothetical protein [Parabacteroides sp. 52]